MAARVTYFLQQVKRLLSAYFYEDNVHLTGLP